MVLPHQKAVDDYKAKKIWEARASRCTTIRRIFVTVFLHNIGHKDWSNQSWKNTGHKDWSNQSWKNTGHKDLSNQSWKNTHQAIAVLSPDIKVKLLIARNDWGKSSFGKDRSEKTVQKHRSDATEYCIWSVSMLFTTQSNNMWNISTGTVFTQSIRTPQLLTIYVLKFEPVQFTTQCCV